MSLALSSLAILLLLLFLIFELVIPSLWHLSSQAARSVMARLSNTGWYTARAQRLHPVLPYLPVAAILILGLVISAFVGDAFVDLVELLRAESPILMRADRQAYEFAHETRAEGATALFTFFTVIGTPVGLGAIVVAAAAILVWRKYPRWAMYLVVTALGGALLNVALKHYVARERPDLSAALRHASGFSFPSGHAMGATVIFGALGYLAARGIRDPRKRSLIFAILASLIAAVCASRIYLGVHWISDIGAGVSAGVVWLATTTLAYETVRRIWRIRGRVG